MLADSANFSCQKLPAKHFVPVKVRSSRLPEREAKVNMEEMWLLGKLTPDFYTIADFGAGRVFQARRIRERRRLQRRLDCLRSDVPHPPRRANC
jgi:hypothetical protein